MKKTFLKGIAYFIFSILNACTTTNMTINESINYKNSELLYGDTENYFQQKLMGKVVIYADNDIDENMIFSLSDNTRRPTKKKDFVLGSLQKGNAFILTLLPGNYFFTGEIKETVFTKRLYLSYWITIGRGDTQFVQVQKEKIKTGEVTNAKYKEVHSGTIYFLSDLYPLLHSQLKITNLINKERISNFNVVISNNIEEQTIFKLNEKDIIPFAVIDNGVNKIYGFKVEYRDGKNNFIASTVGVDGKVLTDKFEYYAKTVFEIEQEKKIADEQKKAEEIRKKIIAENEVKAKKTEEERIAREGDGSPDDLACKKYGLKPQTQGYAECRMRLDLARQETLREQARINAIENARDRARKETLQRQYDEEQQQLSIIANRQSKCRFVQAQEYARFTPGGFFESMKNANNAFDNCMAGVPQINTTCTKDGFGNINCTSR